MAEEFRLLNYDKLDAEMKEYNVELVEPSSHATQKISNKLVKVQGYKDRVQHIVELAVKNTNLLEKAVATKELEVEIATAKSMTNDEDIKNLSSDKKRESALVAKMSDKKMELLNLENLLLDAKSFESRARLRYANLESANKNISRLMSMFGVMFMRGEMQMSNQAKVGKLDLGGGE